MPHSGPGIRSSVVRYRGSYVYTSDKKIVTIIIITGSIYSIVHHAYVWHKRMDTSLALPLPDPLGTGAYRLAEIIISNR